MNVSFRHEDPIEITTKSGNVRCGTYRWKAQLGNTFFIVSEEYNDGYTKDVYYNVDSIERIEGPEMKEYPSEDEKKSIRTLLLETLESAGLTKGREITNAEKGILQECIERAIITKAKAALAAH